MSLQKNSLIVASFFSLTLVMTGCAKHEQAEGGNEAFRTEELAAKQGEAARAAVKEPDAKEPATFTATTAPTSGTASTTVATTTTASSGTAHTVANIASASAGSSTPTTATKTDPKSDMAKKDEKTVVKETTTVTTKTETKK